MKRITTYFTMILALACCLQAEAQDSDADTKPLVEGKEVWSQTKSEDIGGTVYTKFDNRQAFAGKGYTVNKLIQVVGVGSWIKDLNNLTDENLDNYATFPRIVGAGVTANPIVSVRSTEHYFDEGTEAGFCMVASSGDNVLSLDVIKALSIGVYRDGELLETLAVEDGQSASGIGLSLIKIPGSEDACAYLTIKPHYIFDELCLINAGGVNLEVGGSVRIKYAFAGTPKETKLINDDIRNLETTSGRDLNLEAEGWNPLLLGIPFPISDRISELTDNDKDNNWKEFVELTPIVAIGYQGGVKLVVKPTTDDRKGEVFKKGDEVGFKFINASAVDLGVGSTITICLFNKDGDKIDEQTVSSGVLALAVGEGDYAMASIVANKDFSGAELRFYTGIAVKLGALGVCYGFVREKPNVEHNCAINPTISTNVCDEQTSYQLEANHDLSVSWSLVSQPKGANVSVTPSGQVTNMTVRGEYVFRATSLSCPNDPKCHEDITLNVGEGLGSMNPEEAGGTPLINKEGETAKYETSKPHETSGSLVSVSDLENYDNIVNDKTDDCAECIGGLAIANNLHIAGVKTKDGSLIFDGEDKQNTQFKAGFVVEYTTTGLDLSALQYFQIRCYKNGKKVCEGVITESNTVSVGLAGSNQVQKVRFSAIFDACNDEGTPIQFDEITLWKSGVLDLNLSVMRIYYAFVQEQYDPATDVDNPLACVTARVSTEETNASINGNGSQMAAAVAVGGVIDNLSYFVDDDLETPMKVVNTVGLGKGSIIAVNMGRTLDFRHQLCIVVDDKTYLAGVNVGNWLKVTTFMNGEPTGDEFKEWNVLGVNAIGYGDKRIMMMQPKSNYDEVRLEIAGVAGVLDFQNFFGMFLRGDIDADGNPDCTDPESCDTDIEGIEATEVCKGDIITITGKGLTSTDYYIQLPDQNINEKFTTDKDGYFEKSFQLNKPGRYTMTFRDGSGIRVGSATYVVHPLVTTWRKDAASTDWNAWNNWTAGSPYCCTDAVIPQGAQRYPVLDGTVSTGDEYCVQGIHFEPGAAVDRVYKLNYDKAWVEMDLEPNRYYMLGAPLKDMYTGDMFIPKNGTPIPAYFTELDKDNMPENRFSPRIYQRLWARTAPGRRHEGIQNIVISETRWSHNFNSVSFDYSTGAGAATGTYNNAFSMWVDNENLPDTTTFRFRFPKMHTRYNYYEDFGQTNTGISENVSRGDGPYRFVYEQAGDGNKSFKYIRKQPGTNGEIVDKRTVYLSAKDYTARLNVETAATDGTEACFAAANPFMSRIDVAKFLEVNREKVASVGFYDGNTMSTVMLGNDGSLVSTQGGVETIEPMQGFFVTAKDAIANPTTLDVTFSASMMSPDVAETGSGAEAGDDTQQASQPASLLRMTVSRRGDKASTVVTETEGARARTIIENEASPKVAVFTVADGSAYDICPAYGRAYIPVGILTSGADTLTLSFEAQGRTELDNYELYDNVTYTAYPLDAQLTFSGMGSSIGRFAIRDRRQSPSLEENGDEGIYIAVQDGRAIIRSARPDIIMAETYTAGGVKTGEYTSKGTVEAVIGINKGINIVKVTLGNGETKTFKVM